MRKLILTMLIMSVLSAFCYAESCKGSQLKVEYKDDIPNCTFHKRTCCEDGTWSGWNMKCPKNCPVILTGMRSFYYGYANGGSGSGPEKLGERYVYNDQKIYFPTKAACEQGLNDKIRQLSQSGYTYLGDVSVHEKMTIIQSNSLDCKKNFKEVQFKVPYNYYNSGPYKGETAYCSCREYNEDKTDLLNCSYELYIYTCAYIQRSNC